jgi:hypothetical protein
LVPITICIHPLMYEKLCREHLQLTYATFSAKTKLYASENFKNNRDYSTSILIYCRTSGIELKWGRDEQGLPGPTVTTQ